MKKIKVLMAKPGLDGHDRGALVIVQALRDAGMDVIYTGIRKTPEYIAKTALEEKVDCVGLSCLSGAHRTVFPEVVRQMRKLGVKDDVLVLGGGIIPDADIPYLLSHGIAKIFTPGTKTADVARTIHEHMRETGNAICVERAFM